MFASLLGKPKDQEEAQGPDVPVDTLDIHILNPALAGDGKVQYEVDIVAVHGLGGDAFKTWTADNGKMWLRDFLLEDLKNPQDEKAPCLARVMTFGYNVSVYSKAASQRSSTFAEDLLSALHDFRQGPSSRRPIIFIGHSLGGIVIKKALILARLKPAEPAYIDFLESVRHLMFFGTPHQGTSHGANFIRSTGAAITRASDGSVLRELDLWSPWTLETNNAFAGIAEGFTITTFWEREDYHGIKVVDEGSARLNKPNETVIGLDAHHLTMCKFPSKNSLYLKVLRRLSAEIAAIGTPVGEDEHEPRVRKLFESWFSCSNDPLSTPDPRVAENHEPGTNAWFLEGEVFHDWRIGNPRALWLHGGMGCGKTWLSTTTDQKLRHEAKPKDRIATCYFSNTSTTISTRTVMYSLLSQLGMRQKVHPALHDLCKELEEKPTVVTPTSQQLQDTLTKVLKSHDGEGETYILVDALDEIPFQTMHDERAKIAELLNTLVSSQTPRLHLLMTSRPHDDLIKSFADPRATWNARPIPPDNIQADIKLYVRSKITKLAEGLYISEADQKRLIARLSGPKQTMFRLAALQLKRLQSKRLLRSSDIENVLKSLPSEINSMYDKILQDDIPEDDLPLAMKVLRWLAASYRPLSIMEVSEACTIPPERELRGAKTLRENNRLTQEQLLNLLPNLVISIQADWPSGEERGYSSLAFSHFSVKEYLMGSQLLGSPSANFRIQPKDAHSLVAKECLAYIFISGEMGSSGCLTQYASEHWQLHAVATGELDERTRRYAFLLSASVLSVARSNGKEKLPPDFVRVTRWLEDPESLRKLLSSLSNGYSLTNGSTMRLFILYPQDGTESMIRYRAHRVSSMYAPSFEAIYRRLSDSDRVTEVLCNGEPMFATESTFQMLQSLRQDLISVRLIWWDTEKYGLEDRISPTSSEMYRRAERVVVHLGGKPENDTRNWLHVLTWLSSPNPPSTPEWRERHRRKVCLLALEKLLSKESSDLVACQLFLARGVVFLYGAHELSLDDIRESLDQLPGRAHRFNDHINDHISNAFKSGYLYEVRNRLDGLPRQPELDFPWTRAMLELLQRP